ncbi:MAG: lysophospholipase [Microthrixaceae bacterium]|nr:lysophospholipase [Microthrixaceae bacterium]MCO5313942.1 lysophospholipase [Microthrixaceae bacterium]HPB46606.1 lysophospholipase [Microthrixaceae bacterium]
MRSTESSFVGAGGVRVYTVEWLPEGEPVADIVLIHGYGEHSGRYLPWVERFVAAGYRVASLDHRGHGKTTGVKRGEVDSFDSLVDDLSAYVDAVRCERPLFLYGHSMGGLAATRLAERGDERFAGIVLTGPALAVADAIPSVLVKVANVVGKLAPKLPTIQLDGNAISRVQEVRDAYDADPLNFRGKMTAGTGRELNVNFAAAHAQAARISVPLLVLHGEADALAAVEGSRNLVTEVSSTDVTLRTWPGAFHELHHEPERDEVFEVVSDWLAAHR